MTTHFDNFVALGGLDEYHFIQVKNKIPRLVFYYEKGIWDKESRSLFRNLFFFKDQNTRFPLVAQTVNLYYQENIQKFLKQFDRGQLKKLENTLSVLKERWKKVDPANDAQLATYLREVTLQMWFYNKLSKQPQRKSVWQQQPLKN